MLLFSIFIFSAALTFYALRAPLLQRYFTRGPRREGVAVVGAVLLASLLGWIAFYFLENRQPPGKLFNPDGIYLLVIAGA